MEASLRVGVQDARAWYPPFEDRSEQLPFLACALTATKQNISPQPVHTLAEGAHLLEVTGHLFTSNAVSVCFCKSENVVTKLTGNEES